jgi:propionyl-CoA synthetase
MRARTAVLRRAPRALLSLPRHSPKRPLSSLSSRYEHKENGATETGSSYANEFARSVSGDRSDFWREAAARVHWDIFPPKNAKFLKEKEAVPRNQKVGQDGLSEWFRGGFLNQCFNCVDVHVQSGHGGDVALIHDSPALSNGSTGSKGGVSELSYEKLLSKVSF